MKIYANLHTHSTHSDGVYTPAELVKIAKEEGYRALAITDHDTATAFPELKAACEKEGMECIFGVEFSVKEPGDYHIVGLDFDPEYPPMKKYLEDMALRQTDNTKKCFDEAVSLGNISGVTWEDVLEFNKGVKWLCNNHVYNAMKAKGLVKESEYMAWFELNFRHQRGKYPPSIKFKPLREMIELIKAAGGFAVWAHPCEGAKLGHFDELLEAGIEGIEVWHPSNSEEEQKIIYDLAIKNKLFISGGSDHSGLCGGYYSSYPTLEALKASKEHYIPELSAGTTEKHFREIVERKISENR